MKIVILDGSTVNPGDNPWTGLAASGDLDIFARTTPGEVVSRCRGADVVVVNKVRLGAAEFEVLPDLKLVAITATGFDCVDGQAARERGIDVCNVPVYSSDSVAQFVFAHLLHIVQNVALHDRLVRQGEWRRSGDFCFWRTDLVELAGKTMGVVGWGRIGQRVGQLAHAFGMRVISCSRREANAPDFDDFAWRQMSELFAESDVVSLHCPLTPDTRHIVDREMLSRMKNSAILINTSRGDLIVEADLANALAAGELAAAAIDVASQEPIDDANPLLDAPNCTISPHMAWATLASRQRLMNVTAENIAAFADGRPQNIVN